MVIEITFENAIRFMFLVLAYKIFISDIKQITYKICDTIIASYAMNKLIKTTNIESEDSCEKRGTQKNK